MPSGNGSKAIKHNQANYPVKKSIRLAKEIIAKLNEKEQLTEVNR